MKKSEHFFIAAHELTRYNLNQMRAGKILKKGGFGAQERDTQRLLKSPSFGTFLGEARKVHTTTIREILLQKFSTGPVECGKKFCGQIGAEISSTTPC
ncbi:MAG: hypothetical protein IJO21_07310 [Oscillospiraceae bacterium]|nr:hypothetical protein [Oscillospiraceae bacterium]MBQ7130829.1 hypothetical protein [Oscillospiraceae bacterium]